MASLAKTVRNGNYGAVVLDNYSPCIAGQDENSQAVASLAMANFRRAIDANNATGFVVHHSNANGEIRGSKVLAAAVDVIFKLTRDDKSGTIVIENTKMRDDERWRETRSLIMRDITLDGWLDEDGQAVRTLALDYDPAAARVTDPKSASGGTEASKAEERVQKTVEKTIEQVLASDPLQSLSARQLAPLPLWCICSLSKEGHTEWAVQRVHLPTMIRAGHPAFSRASRKWCHCPSTTAGPRPSPAMDDDWRSCAEPPNTVEPEVAQWMAANGCPFTPINHGRAAS